MLSGIARARRERVERSKRLAAIERESDRLVDAASEAAALLRRLIGEIVISPLGRYQGVAIEIRGDLAALLARDGEARFMPGVVAGAGFEPATFRL